MASNKMVYAIVFVAFCHKIAQSDAVTCGSGWVVFEDSKCLQLVDTFVNREVAITTCAELGTNGSSNPQVLSIKSPAEQEFVTNWLFNELGLVDSVWLNGDRNGSNFVWRDGDSMSFTNWAVGFPTNESTNGCVQISPRVGMSDTIKAENGEWMDVPCSKRDLVVCEKRPTLSLEELQDMVYDMKSNPVPMGFTFVQLPNEPSPESLWSNLIWKDVTAEYAGLFFRAEGGSAADFGTVQVESSKRLVAVRYGQAPSQFATTISMPTTDVYSEIVLSGFYYSASGQGYSGLQFHNSVSETRPQNTAIRIWRRV